jgi:hypothetical protein
MFDKALVAFDIETTPDPGIGRRMHNLTGTDAEVIVEMVHKRREETNGSTDYPQSPFHRVVCICATIVRHARVEIRRLPGDDERTILESFHALVRELSPRLVTWNGGGFDLPVLRYRSMLHGLAAPGFYALDGDPRTDGYAARYGTMHIDLMERLSGFGASSHAGLASVARLLELPGKSFLDRAVWEYWVAGDTSRVIEHCKLDTVLTTLIFLSWSHHTGLITREEALVLIQSAREAIGREPYEGWRAIESNLEKWPRWA